MTESSNLSTQTEPGIEEIPQISGFSLIYKGFRRVSWLDLYQILVRKNHILDNYATRHATRNGRRGAREINNPMERDQKKWIIDF